MQRSHSTCVIPPPTHTRHAVINGSAPSLIDGAQSVARMGSKVIKVAMFSPESNYPFNSPKWPPAGFPTLLSMAQHPYYRELWAMPQFTTYVLIAYSTVGGTSGGDISYWRNGITETQIAEETAQLQACAEFLLKTYGIPLKKTFVFENWEGDWASRGATPKSPASLLARTSMRQWLGARQAGVTAARIAANVSPAAEPGTGNVLYSAEVNLVRRVCPIMFPHRMLARVTSK
jgi:hypothetical protein